MSRKVDDETHLKRQLATQAAKPKFEVIPDYEGDLKNGSEARRYADGAVRNNKGQLLEPAPGLVPFNSETGRAAQVKRWSDNAEGFAEGLTGGLDLPENVGNRETWKQVGYHMGQAIKAGNVNRLPDIVRIASELGNFAPSKNQVALLEQESEAAQPYTPKQIEAMGKLIDLAKQAAQGTRETIEGKVSDV